MHKFLRTVGFSNYKKKHDIEKLLQDLIDQVDPSQIHKIQIDEETNLCQVRAEMAHDMGLDIYWKWMSLVLCGQSIMCHIC